MHNHHDLGQHNGKCVLAIVIATHQQNIPGPSADACIVRRGCLVAVTWNRANKLIERLMYTSVIKIGQSTSTAHDDQQKNSQRDDKRMRTASLALFLLRRHGGRGYVLGVANLLRTLRHIALYKLTRCLTRLLR